MNWTTDPTPETHILVGGDFTSVFDHEDYMIMFNSLDEVSVVLRAHLILEEFLSIWCSRVGGLRLQNRNTSFMRRLKAAKALGLSQDYYVIMEDFNYIRNCYAHERKYRISQSVLDALKEKVNMLPSNPPMHPCDHFHIFAQGKDQFGRPQEVRHDWVSSDTKKRVLLVFVQLVMKLVQWMQSEFNRRGIEYTIIAWPSND